MKNFIPWVFQSALSLPALVSLGALAVVILHILRAAGSEPMTQIEVTLFTVLELMLSIWASAAVSAHYAKKNAVSDTHDNTRLFGQAAIRRVDAVVNSLDQLNVLLLERQNIIQKAGSNESDIFIEYLAHASSVVQSAKTSALSAIEDWTDFSGISRESTSTFTVFMNRLRDIEVTLEEKETEMRKLTELKSSDANEKTELQRQIKSLKDEKAKIQHDLDRERTPVYLRTTIGASGFDGIRLPYESPITGVSQSFGINVGSNIIAGTPSIKNP